MGSLSFFTSKGGELLYNFSYLAACVIVIFMLFYEWRRTGTRDKLYLLYAFVVMLVNLIFINLSLAQEIFFGATRSYFWFPIITWNLKALSLIFITGAFIYPVAHKQLWLKKYLSYNIILLVFSFCIVTPLWLNKYFELRDYNRFWGSYYYNSWLCLILLLTIAYLHFYAAEYYPNFLFRAFLGILFINQAVHLGRIVFPDSSLTDLMIILDRSLPSVSSFVLVLTIYKSIVSSLVKINCKLDVARRELDRANQRLEKKVLERTKELTDANKELLRFKEFHENILQSLTNGVLVLSAQERIMAVNRASEEALKIEGREVVGKKLSSVLPAPEQMGWEQLIGRVIGSEEELRLNKVQCVPSRLKREIVLNLSAQPLRDRELQKIGVVLTLEFITEKVKLEEEIKRTEKLAYMGRIAAGVAHEVRNPLNSISINLQLLRRELLKSGGENSGFIGRLKVIGEEITRLDGIVNEFLQFGRPKKVRLRKGDINRVIEEVVSLIKQQACLAGVEVRERLEPGLPPVLLDEAQIKQVFLNLGINAIQAMPHGGKLFFQSKILKRDGILPGICVNISDTGAGMSAEEQKHIFEPFYSSKEGGMGLGLAIVQHIVQEHRGNIDLRSRPGKGTTFSVILPQASAAQAAGG